MSRPITILAIDPGLRAMGVAVFAGAHRLRQTLVVTTGAREPTARRLRRVREQLQEVFAYHKPDLVLMEATWPSKNRSLAIVHRVSRLCTRMCRDRRVRVVTVPTATVRKAILGYGKAGKTELAAFVASVYPELRIYLHQDEVWKERHFRNLFDAVALGVWYRQLPKAQRRHF